MVPSCPSSLDQFGTGQAYSRSSMRNEWQDRGDPGVGLGLLRQERDPQAPCRDSATSLSPAVGDHKCEFMAVILKSGWED